MWKLVAQLIGSFAYSGDSCMQQSAGDESDVQQDSWLLDMQLRSPSSCNATTKHLNTPSS